MPVSIYWLLSHKVPKCPQDKIGFLVSIKSEGAQEGVSIRRDFGHEVAELLKLTPIHVMQLTAPHVNRVVDFESALHYSNKSRAHFHVFGDVRKRRVNNKEVYALRLEGMVRHAPTTPDNQRGLANEMTEVLPLKINLPLEDDLMGFEFTSVWMAESTKYVIATASMFSQDYGLAIGLLEELNGSRKNLENKLKKSPAPGVKALVKKLPDRLAKSYLLASESLYKRWRETRDFSDLEAGWVFVQKYDKLNKNTRNFYLYQAIWLFVSQRDAAGSLRSIMACVSQNISDPTWRYSAAFLEAYRGNEDKSLQNYSAAIDFGVKADLFFEVEEFINWVVSIEPERYQLHFCLGLINCKAKGDTRTGKQDLEIFLKLRKSGEFEKFAVSAEALLREIGAHE